MTDQLGAAARAIRKAVAVVCLTGAGVSAESGIPTFREAQTGLWARFDPETLASPSGFARNPGLVWRWYRERLRQVQSSQPNPGHLALARLEERTPRFTLITQNVDNLHEIAGSRNVIHLHGRIDQFRCSVCFAPAQPDEDALGGREPPACSNCGAFIRPDVVWFGENLPEKDIDAAVQATVEADLLISIGTSGIVYPAAHLPTLARESGAHLIDMNPEPNPLGQRADIWLQGASGEILPRLVELVFSENE